MQEASWDVGTSFRSKLFHLPSYLLLLPFTSLPSLGIRSLPYNDHAVTCLSTAFPAHALFLLIAAKMSLTPPQSTRVYTLRLRVTSRVCNHRCAPSQLSPAS